MLISFFFSASIFSYMYQSKRTKGTISAGHQLTSEAGLQMYLLGGNAFDAALAAMLASCVAEPCTTSAGGGGFMLTHDKNGESLLHDFFSQTPRNKRQGKLDFYPVALQLGATTQEFHIGMASAAVPGFIRGWWNIYQRYASLPVKELIQPAVKLAKEGVVLTTYQRSVIDMLAPIMTRSATGRDIYQNKENGDLICPGSTYYMPQFADALALLSSEGDRPFYEGEIARSIVKASEEMGGHLQMEDFLQYKSIIRQALQVSYGKYKLLTNPPPSSGGALICFSLALLANSSIDASTADVEWIPLLLSAMKNTNDARKKQWDGQQYQAGIAERFLSEETLNSYRPLKRGCTTHISTWDEKGNAVAVTTSMGEGCGFFIPGTQIILNNMLGEEDLHPNGFHSWPCDQRLSSMMSPSMVFDAKDQLRLVTGSGGANRIRTAILQVLIHSLQRGKSIAEAVNHPRLHFENGQLYAEPGFNAKWLYELPDVEGITQWQELHHFFGGAHSIFKSENGQIQGAGDVRRDGVALSS